MLTTGLDTFIFKIIIMILIMMIMIMILMTAYFVWKLVKGDDDNDDFDDIRRVAIKAPGFQPSSDLQGYCMRKMRRISSCPDSPVPPIMQVDVMFTT